ncbi:hypothetical protein GCM10017577_74180 [Pseudonocardia halophobica]|uniref:Uncharacterized protein n=1 Tax=Pseudonocardia halophobica TaxID=29401 RepID=A0A9W6P1U6_9PSEU|nr:hypothetical protein [Pseudonocardia halophobica]GLL16258.1 hypothetical protein GCM10017577_74180 [Pseudonocardia halophobica]
MLVAALAADVFLTAEASRCGDDRPGLGGRQYPYLLGTHLPIAAAAARFPRCPPLTVVAAAALVLVAPSMGLLFVLQQRGRLDKAS